MKKKRRVGNISRLKKARVSWDRTKQDLVIYSAARGPWLTVFGQQTKQLTGSTSVGLPEICKSHQPALHP